jgi:hypothetical protein
MKRALLNQRLLDSNYISEESKEQLRERYRLLNPARLKQKIEKLQQKLLASAVSITSTRKQQSAKRRAPKPPGEMARSRKATKSIASLKRLEQSGKKAA